MNQLFVRCEKVKHFIMSGPSLRCQSRWNPWFQLRSQWRDNLWAEGSNSFCHEVHRKIVNTEYFWEVYIEEIPIPNTRNWGHNYTHNQIRDRVGTVIYSGNFTIWTRVMVLQILSVSFRELDQNKQEKTTHARKPTFVHFPDRCNKSLSLCCELRLRAERSRWAITASPTRLFTGNLHQCRWAGTIPAQVYFPRGRWDFYAEKSLSSWLIVF